MKKNILNGAIVSVLLGIAIVPFAGCDTGSSVKDSAPAADTTTTPTTPDTDTNTVTPTDATKVDFFKDASIVTTIAEAFEAEVGDMNATWDDDSTIGKATSDMSFSANATGSDSGASFLKVTATALQNRYAHTVAQWSFKTDFAKAGITAPVDLTGKTVSIKANIPTGSALTAVKLTFIDNEGRKSQGKEMPITTNDTWNEVTYKYVDGTTGSDYTVPGFDITKVTGISIVGIKNGASAASSETLYIDSLSW